MRPRAPVLLFDGACPPCLRMSRLAVWLSIGTLTLRDKKALTNDDHALLTTDWRGELAVIRAGTEPVIGTVAVFRALPGTVLQHWGRTMIATLQILVRAKRRPLR